MIYLVAIFISPLALLLYGKVFQAIFNLILYVAAIVLTVTLLFSGAGFGLWLIGVIHAILTINQVKADRRAKAMLDAIEKKRSAA